MNHKQVKQKYLNELITGAVTAKEVSQKHNIPISTVYRWVTVATKNTTKEEAKFKASLVLIKNTAKKDVQDLIKENEENMNPEDLLELVRNKFLIDSVLDANENLYKHAKNISNLIDKTKATIDSGISTPKDLQSISAVLKNTSSLIMEVYNLNLEPKAVKQNTAKNSTPNPLQSYGSTSHKPVS